jgi:hypothetical protein
MRRIDEEYRPLSGPRFVQPWFEFRLLKNPPVWRHVLPPTSWAVTVSPFTLNN